MMRISGKTYEYKHLLVEFGAKWEPATKTWMIEDQQWEKLVSRSTGGLNKKGREQTAAVMSWVAEPIVADAKAAAIAEIRAMMARHGVTIGDLTDDAT